MDKELHRCGQSCRSTLWYEAVSHLVSRFIQSGGTCCPGTSSRWWPCDYLYADAQRERILAEVRRRPHRDRDGTATWSLTTLQRALREAPDGLPEVSTHTIWKTLKEAGFEWQRDRSWCQTGVVERKRKGEVVKVIDPDAASKKS